MMVLCPANFAQLHDMPTWAVNDCAGPVAVRYPRGGMCCDTASAFLGDPTNIDVLSDSDDEVATIITYGPIAAQVREAVKLLAAKHVQVRQLNLQSVTHFSEMKLAQEIRGKHVLVVEETCSGSGVSDAIALHIQQQGVSCSVHALDLGKDFVPHGDMNNLYRLTGLDCESIADYICEVLRHEN